MITLGLQYLVLPSVLKRVAHGCKNLSSFSGISEVEPESEIATVGELDLASEYDHENNSSNDEFESNLEPPVSPAIDRSEDTYVSYYDRTGRSCSVPNGDADVTPKFQPSTDQKSDYINKEDGEAVEKERKRRLRSCYFRGNTSES